jgi:hypothetical protein
MYDVERGRKKRLKQVIIGVLRSKSYIGVSQEFGFLRKSPNRLRVGNRFMIWAFGFCRIGQKELALAILTSSLVYGVRGKLQISAVFPISISCP